MTGVLHVSYERSEVLDLFLALQRELTGRFAHEIQLLPAPVLPRIARFVAGIRAWKAAGVRTLPAVVAEAGDLPDLLHRCGQGPLRDGAPDVVGALEEAAPALRAWLATFEDLRGEARADLAGRLPLCELGGRLRAALGAGPAPLSLPLHLVTLAPHYPGAGFLSEGGRLVSAYADCRRLRGSALADGVLTLLGWALLRSAPGPGDLSKALAAWLPGGRSHDRRLRAVLTKVVVETTAAHLVRETDPGHRPGVDVLGTAWRYPRLFDAVERHWSPHLAGAANRDDALAAMTAEIAGLHPRWYLDRIDAAALAADFYVLELLSASGDPEARRRFHQWAPLLADHLAGQLDLVVGGELGHFERVRGAVGEPLATFLRRVSAGDSRVAWSQVASELGRPRALELAEQAFTGPGVAYGGEAWAPVTAVLRAYVRHELPHAAFLDQCFTLEHNNGSLFDKYFDTDGLRRVLDLQAAGDLDGLAGAASAQVRSLWRAHEARRRADHDPVWLADPAPAAEPPPVPAGSRPAVATARAPAPGALGCGSPLEPARMAAGGDPGPPRRPAGHRPRLGSLRLPEPEPWRGATATLHTSLGDVHLELWPDLAPYTVANFAGLADGSRRWRDPVTGLEGSGAFYTGTTFHRRVPGFLVAAGDRTRTGLGGPGYRIPDEIPPQARFDRPFLLAMGNTGPNSAGSQFFVTLAAAEHLTGAYTQFGEVADAGSQAVVAAVAEADGVVTLRSVTVQAW